MSPKTLCIMFLVFFSQRAEGLIFSQGTTSVRLPFDFPVASTFHRLSVLDDRTGREPRSPPLFQLLRVVAFPGDRSTTYRGLFVVDEWTGSVMLSPHRRRAIRDFRGSTFALDIAATSTNLTSSGNSTHSTVVVTISDDSLAQSNCQPRPELCFPVNEIHFQVPEVIPNGTVLGNIKPMPYTKMCPQVNTQYLLHDGLLIVSNNGEVRTNGSFDYEDVSHHRWSVDCKVTSGNVTQTFHGEIQVFVMDVDDNPPYVQDTTNLNQELDVSQILPGRPLPIQLTVLDPDSASVNDFSVRLRDPFKLFYLRDPVVFHGVNKTRMLINAAIVPKPHFHFPESSYNISVIFDDKSLVNARQNRQIVFHIHIFNTSNEVLPNASNTDDFQVVRNIFRHSSHHARVAQPMEDRPHEGYFFRLSGEQTWGGLPGSRIFGVTPATGIVYVRDEAALARSPDTVFRLQLTWRSKEEADRKCTLTLRVFDASDPRNVCGSEPGRHFPGCALHATLESCQSSCGRGAPDGLCRWRSAAPRAAGLSSRFATCSPDLATCPDGTCDELEQLDPLLCPQDCAGHIRGEAVPGSLGKGIALSAAPCTCPGPKTCVCIRMYPSFKRERKPKSGSRAKEIAADEPRTVPATALELHDEWSQCGSVCAAMIAVVSLVVTGLVLSAGFLVCRRLRGSAKSPEFPTLTTPLHPSSRARPGSRPPQRSEDPLEFPKDRLVLEEVVGEGEFGKVMKGKARDIGGVSGTTTVAVKMLKDDSSPSERRDLLSELNLLKDVSHPNVIRLLGACTIDGGPLYVIVEFAEHGSLILYLRRMRARFPEAGGDFRELLSFAWQIARGMQYLAEMKIVHRDLAARNVLVAEGKVMKISDFGLSRDVYERETYQKRSKGRVPVKWMALESLQDHLYTTKSDVWSFGILLWEIITLGGCPYPGVSTEQLFSLLKGGYRMSRPDDCPIPLYHLMTQCWREKPQDRPHFKELVAKIDVILRDSQHYLPLREEECPPPCKKLRGREESSVMTQLTFPKLNVVAHGPYENRRLLSPSEFSV